MKDQVMAKETRRPLHLGDTVVWFARPEPTSDARARPGVVTRVHADDQTVDVAVILHRGTSLYHADGVRSYSAIKNTLSPGAHIDPTVCSSGVWITPEEHRALLDKAAEEKRQQAIKQQQDSIKEQQQETARRKIKELLSSGKTIEEVVALTGAQIQLVEHLSQEVPRHFVMH